MKNRAVCQPRNLLIRLLVIISLIGFNSAVFAEEYVSEVKMTNDIQVPKIIHTHTSNVRVTTSVKVEGADEKTNNQVKNSVVKAIKSAMARWEKTSGYKVAKLKPAYKKAVHVKKKKQKHAVKKVSHKKHKVKRLQK